jgi:hypothetical protein
MAARKSISAGHRTRSNFKFLNDQYTESSTLCSERSAVSLLGRSSCTVFLCFTYFIKPFLEKGTSFHFFIFIIIHMKHFASDTIMGIPEQSQVVQIDVDDNNHHGTSRVM